MIKIHYMGTCSGTEPMPGMHQTSLVLEVNGIYYWFDAGEHCAYRAQTTGMDVLQSKAIFLTHMHVDHIGGLANLLECMNCMVWRKKAPMVNENRLQIYTPVLDVLHAVKSVARGSTTVHKFFYEIEDHLVEDGVLYDDGTVRVTALHNSHLFEDGSQGWHSYSYLIEAEGKRIVCSGDIQFLTELDPLVRDGCDYLMVETGHHKVKDVCEYAVKMKAPRLRFYHHGREIINGRSEAERLVASYPIDIRIAFDGMTEEI
ncbi:MAG: ribonuclease Z [Clostridia bacterium]|nr:ribonuclease Z [Clostridia bacterium]